MTLTDYMCQEKKEEEDIPALKTALMHQYNNLKITYKSTTATKINTDNIRTKRATITRKQKWEEKQLYGCFKQLISNITQENVDMAKNEKP